MTDKQEAVRAIRKLPDDASLADIIEELQILNGVLRGIEAADSGDVIPHEEVMAQMRKWLSQSNGRGRRVVKSAKS